MKHERSSKRCCASLNYRICDFTPPGDELKGAGHIVSMVPDVPIPSPLIGAAQVTVRSHEEEEAQEKGLGRSGPGSLSTSNEVSSSDPSVYTKPLYF